MPAAEEGGGGVRQMLTMADKGRCWSGYAEITEKIPPMAKNIDFYPTLLTLTTGEGSGGWGNAHNA